MPYVRVLNEEDVNGASQIKMTYDAPASNIGIYIAYVYKDGRYVINKLGETNSLLARTRNVSSCIKDAYLRFNEWWQSHITATDWYKYSEQEKVF